MEQDLNLHFPICGRATYISLSVHIGVGLFAQSHHQVNLRLLVSSSSSTYFLALSPPLLAEDVAAAACEVLFALPLFLFFDALLFEDLLFEDLPLDFLLLDFLEPVEPPEFALLVGSCVAAKLVCTVRDRVPPPLDDRIFLGRR